jgi:hypothetical protein
MTLNDSFPPFLLHGQVERGYSRQTLDKFRDCFHAWIQPRLGQTALKDIAYLHLLEFRKAMTEAGLIIASPASTASSWCSSSCFDFAVRDCVSPVTTRPKSACRVACQRRLSS